MRLPVLPLALLAACAFANGTGPRDTATSGTDSGTPATGSCPVGTQAATDATLRVDELTIDGSTVPGTFDITATVDGQPSACISPAGDEAILLLADGAGNLSASIRLQASAVGAYDMSLDPGFSLTVLVEDPTLGTVTWSAWSQGDLTVTSLQSRLDWTVLDGTAASAGAELILAATASVTP